MIKLEKKNQSQKITKKIQVNRVNLKANQNKLRNQLLVNLILEEKQIKPILKNNKNIIN
jgi:hypothetical protein